MQKEKFGSLDLADVIISEPGTESERSELDEQIAEVESSSYGVEKAFLLSLRQRRISFEYPELNTAFLATSHQQTFLGEVTLDVPSFAVYQVCGEAQSSVFGIEVDRARDQCAWCSFCHFHWEIWFSYRDVRGQSRRMELPSIIEDQLLEGLGVEKWSKDTTWSYRGDKRWDIPKYLRKSYEKLESFRLMSSLNGVVPSAVRSRIQTAEEVFGARRFFISEVEEWNYNKRPAIVASADPLVIGEYGGKIFLIDCFDPTSLEKWVTLEQTK